jgi:hypothetical protein
MRVPVKEGFDYPLMGDLAARLCGDSQPNQSQPKAAPMPLQLEDSFLEPYQLLKGDDPEAFIDREVTPQLNQEDRHLIMDASCIRLEEACNTLVQYFDILRIVW